MEGFGERLRKATAARGPLCVGIDPHPALLERWGVGDNRAGLERFLRTVVEALAEQVAVFKPQSAFFERFGSHGISLLETTIRDLRASGALVLLDVKRGDIGSTMAAYAAAYLDPSSSLYSDAITVSPYLGVGALTPAVETARTHGGGVFALALTSNPEGAAVQRARGSDGRTVAQAVVDEISQLNAGAEGLGSVGVVVGATVGEADLDLSRLAGPILVPGLGAQGGTPAGLRRVFGDELAGILPSYSRQVLAEGPTVAGLRAAAERARAECAAVLSP